MSTIRRWSDEMRSGDVLARSIMVTGVVPIILFAALDAFTQDPPRKTPQEKPSLHGAALKTGRELIDHREDGDSLDRAVQMLEEDAARQPDSPETRILLTEAYTRALDRLQDGKDREKEKFSKLLLAGKSHGEAALKLAPADGAAVYWRACILLHEADWYSSLGRAKGAIRLLEKAESLRPEIDDGGPARMRGKVLAEMPGIFGGSLSEAVSLYKKALEQAPDCMTTHLWLGEAYADQGKRDLARSELNKVLAATPRPRHKKEDAADQKEAEERLKKLK